MEQYLKLTNLLDNSDKNINFTIFKSQIHKKGMKFVYVQSKYGIHKIPYETFFTKRGVPLACQVNSVCKNQYIINKLNDIFNYKYDYSKFNYIDVKTPCTITCRKHGEFKMKASQHLSKRGCRECGIESSALKRCSDTKTFIKKAMKRLGTTQDIYDRCEYVHARAKVLIKCKKHGYYKITPNDHLTGYGCKNCAEENAFWGESEYEKMCNGRKPVLYKIKIYNEEEEFVKIGITVEGVYKRFIGNKLKNLGYKHEVLKVIQGDARYIWRLEKRVHSFYRKYKYTPKKWFKGHTECYKIKGEH